MYIPGLRRWHQGCGDTHVQHKESLVTTVAAADPNGHMPVVDGLGWSQPLSSASTRLMTEPTQARAEPSGCHLVGQGGLRGPWDRSTAQWVLVVLSNSIKKDNVKNFKMFLWAFSFLRGEKEASAGESQTPSKTPAALKTLGKKTDLTEDNNTRTKGPLLAWLCCPLLS